MSADSPRAGDDGALRVLLLEDSGFDAELLQMALRRSHPRASLACVSGEAAFTACLRTQRVDLILSDYELPGFTGSEALKIARALAPEVPFIFVSGVIGEDNAVELLRRGATDYVSKGRLERLALVIDRALAEARERRARQDAERQAREADAVFARVVDALQDYAVILLDAQGTILSWNRAARLIFGHAADAVLGRRAELLFTAEDRAADVFGAELRMAAERGRAGDSRWMLRADGTRFRAQGTVVPLPDDDGVLGGFCKVVHDSTAMHDAAQQLRVAKEEAERANHAKDRFIAVLSHELRTPLAPISAAIPVLQRAATVPERYAHLLPMIARNVELEARLIEDLLDLTTLAAGKLVLRKEPVVVHRLLHEVVQMLGAELDEKMLELVVALDEREATVWADSARLQQVIWNLLRNAVKFTPVRGRIEIRTAIVASAFELRCIDTGIGIDASALPRIFEPFEQVDSEVSRRFGGLGLGLSIARGIVDQHGGSLSAASDGIGRGATFTLRLPLMAAAAPAPVAASPAPRTQARLLLVEDNEDAGEALKVALEFDGHSVVRAGSCAEARAAARAQRFDLMIADIDLPDGSGLSLPRELDLPCIALSGFGAVQDREASAAVGCVAHLVKPVDLDTLQLTIADVLGSPVA
ncbi:hybrid sensor histidine kinase/response regulator [Solimonas soli]|uniref:hybrid sensor histidine kinase/response regulator n=1 Tax=Solimonas soli TaxID=413479 RepID=UPI0004ADBD13|nr:response regulator [Solimonas soli]